ncbi:hypothetical protein CEXT_492281 [Caerostris extrusa]|uniref:Uncharacterized protein n=1 Tax=Caerostris extrusa TaxID=172846 RepID=A0AAV4TRU8_CAEEX|nr:hypothetical protein CEXT_492281 [Caerostris extrusa]
MHVFLSEPKRKGISLGYSRGLNPSSITAPGPRLLRKTPPSNKGWTNRWRPSIVESVCLQPPPPTLRTCATECELRGEKSS